MGSLLNIPLASLRLLLDLCSDGACIVDPDGWRVVYANPSLLDFTHPPADLGAGRTVFDWLPHLCSSDVRDRLNRLVRGECDETTLEIPVAGDSVGSRVAEVRVRRVDSEQGVLLAIVVVRAAATDRGGAPGGRGGIDPLTGLADRAFLLERLNTVIRGDRLDDDRCAVLFIDVDGFKQVNDAYGHLVGDRVLCEVARRLAGCVRGGDHVARFGGDEFVVLLERVRGRREIEPVIRRIEAAFKRPIALPVGVVTLAVSVGAAQAGVDGDSAEELIGAADRAMYAAKRATA